MTEPHAAKLNVDIVSAKRLAQRTLREEPKNDLSIKEKAGPLPSRSIATFFP
jgi:hypothetical protein